MDSIKDEFIYNIATTNLFDENPTDELVRDWAESVILVANKIFDEENKEN